MKPISALGILKGLAMAALGLVITAGESWSQSDAAAPRTERYVPTIWVDPYGCEHWVLDDGFEDFMTPHVIRDGKPVCSGVAPPNTVTGPFQGGQTVADTF